MADNEPDKGKKTTAQTLIFAAILLILSLQLYIITKPNPQPGISHGLETKIAPALPASPPHTAETHNAPAGDTEELPVGFTVGGRVTQMLFAEGASVRQGDILATLDKEPFEKALAGAKARLQEAQDQGSNLDNLPNPNFAAIEEARAQVEAAQHIYDVAHEELVKRRGLLVSGQLDNVYDNDVQNEHDAALDLQRAERKLIHEKKIGRQALEESGYAAAIRIARNHVSDAESDLADTELLAPGPGVILSRNAEIGDNVAPGATVYVLSVPANPLSQH